MCNQYEYEIIYKKCFGVNRMPEYDSLPKDEGPPPGLQRPMS